MLSCCREVVHVWCWQELQRDIDSRRELISLLSSLSAKSATSDVRMKQDVVLVRNLVQNVVRRFDRVSQRCAERTRQLDVGFREAKAFDDSRNRLMTWIDSSASLLAEMEQTSTATEPEKIRSQISAHREFQRSLGSKQPGPVVFHFASIFFAELHKRNFFAIVHTQKYQIYMQPKHFESYLYEKYFRN